MIHRVTVCQGVGCRFLAPNWPDSQCPQCGGTLVIAALVGGEEDRRRCQLERVLLNQLGTTDPYQVTAWIVQAQLMAERMPPDPDPQPQADGEPVTSRVAASRVTLGPKPPGWTPVRIFAPAVRRASPIRGDEDAV